MYKFFFVLFAIVTGAWSQSVTSIPAATGGGGGGGTITGCGVGQTLNGTVCDENGAVITFNSALQSGIRLTITETSASGTTYTGTMNPALTAYTTGQILTWVVGTACTGGATTHNIDGLGAKSITLSDGSTNPSASDCTAGSVRTLRYDGTRFRLDGGSSGASGGTITLLEPTGKSMDSALAGPGVSANQVIYWKFPVLTSTTVRYYNAYPFSAKGVGTQGFALMDSSCNRVTGSTATVAAPGSAPIRADMGASITLTPGMYYIAYTSTSATDSLFGTRGDFSGQVANQGFADPNLSYFSGATASASGVVPTSCGAQTGLSSSQSLFFVRLSN